MKARERPGASDTLLDELEHGTALLPPPLEETTICYERPFIPSLRPPLFPSILSIRTSHLAQCGSVYLLTSNESNLRSIDSPLFPPEYKVSERRRVIVIVSGVFWSIIGRKENFSKAKYRNIKFYI